MILRIFLTISLLLAPLAAWPLKAEQKLLTPAEMLKKLQEEEETEQTEKEPPFVWPEELPKDLPLYPGIEHRPTKMLEGYYRFNIEVPTTDRAAIIETFRAEGKKKGWTAKSDQSESPITHLFHFTKDGGNLIIRVSSDGTETRFVYFEFMTDEFVKKIKK